MGLFDVFKKNQTAPTDERQREKQIKSLESEIDRKYRYLGEAALKGYASSVEKYRNSMNESIENLRALVGVEGLSDKNLKQLFWHYERNGKTPGELYCEYSRRFNEKWMTDIDSDLLRHGLDFYISYLLGSESENECDITATPDLDMLMKHAAKIIAEEHSRAVPASECIGLFLLELVWNLKENNYPADTKTWAERRKWLKQNCMIEDTYIPALQYMYVKMLEKSKRSYQYEINECTEIMQKTQNFVYDHLWFEKGYWYQIAKRFMLMNLLPDTPDSILETFAKWQREESYEVFAKKYSDASNAYRKAVRLQAKGETQQAHQLMESSADAGHELARKWLHRQKILNGEIEVPDTDKLLKQATQKDTFAMLVIGERILKDGQNAENEIMAMEWFADAACCGSTNGLLRVGKLYEEGKAGLKKNPKHAADLYLHAAEKHKSLKAWMEYARVCPEEEILKTYFKVAQTEPADDKDRELVQEAWNKIAIGIVYDRKKKEVRDYWRDEDEYDLMTGKMCRAGSVMAESCNKILYGRTAACVYGYTMYYLKKNFTSLGKERCEEIAGWAHSLLLGDGTHSNKLWNFYNDSTRNYTGAERNRLFDVRDVVSDVNYDLEKIKALEGDYDSYAVVGYYYLTRSDMDQGDEDRRQRRLEEAMTWMIPALDAGCGKAFYYMASAGRYIGLSHEEILSYYDKSIAAGVEDAAEHKQLYIDARKEDAKLARDLRRLNRKRENFIREAQEANVRRLREENEVRLNNYERDLNLVLYGEAYTNEELGIKLGVNAATSATIDELHQIALNKMSK